MSVQRTFPRVKPGLGSRNHRGSRIGMIPFLPVSAGEEWGPTWNLGSTPWDLSTGWDDRIPMIQSSHSDPASGNVGTALPPITVRVRRLLSPRGPAAGCVAGQEADFR